MMDDASTESNQPTRTHRFRHGDEESVTASVALAVAEVDGVDPTEMEPLYTTVDPALLDALDATGYANTADVTFNYHGYRVRVDSDGDIGITPRTGSDAV
jgi:hypothetical protein